MEDQIAEYNDNLELYLKQIGQLFDIPRIINEPQGKQQIINYYVKNKLTYRLVHNWGGYFHFGISYDGKYKRGDLKEQARIVEQYIHDSNAKNVLELAYGLGANSAYLASRNPLIMFEGIDLSLKPLKRFTKIPNLRFQFGDYHDLSKFDDNAYDIVFVIESLCHSTNKSKVLHEVRKKLKRDGLFIVIDGYRRDRISPLSQSEDTMWKLIEKGWSVDKFECVKDVVGYMQEEYSIGEARDVSKCVLPSVARFESMVCYYFGHPAFGRVINKLLTFDIVKNAIVLLLLPTSIRRQIGCYYIHVLKNDK
jgi:ubiquinone/menaquinone biosynthesis C-methylase UbiE